jgi:hypothetical protein
MSNADENSPARIIERLGDEAKLELLEALAEELGFNVTESVDPQSDVVDLIGGVVQSLQAELGSLQAQFAEGAELDYAELVRIAESVESVISELSEAHENLNAVIASEFDVEDEDEGAEA